VAVGAVVMAAVVIVTAACSIAFLLYFNRFRTAASGCPLFNAYCCNSQKTKVRSLLLLLFTVHVATVYWKKEWVLHFDLTPPQLPPTPTNRRYAIRTKRILYSYIWSRTAMNHIRVFATQHKRRTFHC
jgi:hypothetical protein